MEHLGTGVAFGELTPEIATGGVDRRMVAGEDGVPICFALPRLHPERQPIETHRQFGGMKARPEAELLEREFQRQSACSRNYPAPTAVAPRYAIPAAKIDDV